MKIHNLTMKINRLLICLSSLVLVAHIAGAEKCYPPAKVGSPFSISHTGDVNTKTHLSLNRLLWLIKDAGSSRYVVFSTCNAMPFRCTSIISGFSATIKSIPNGKYKTTSTIENVEISMDKASVQWYIDSDNQGDVCNLEVYDYRPTPSCSAPSLENKGTSTAPNIQVTVVCGISGVFPEPSCDFSQTKSGQSPQTVPSSYVQRDAAVPSGNGDSLTYSRQCAMTRPVTDLTPGKYTFQTLMYPSEVTNGRTYRKTATSFELDFSIGTPTCDQPRLTNSNDDVTVTCRITSVYPKFKCQFYRKKDSGNAVLVGSIIDSTASCANKPSVSCVHQCTLTTPISPLGRGTHSFKVTMTIDGTSQNVDSSLSTGITLSYPAPKITNCPTGVGVKDGYIKQGTHATCECTSLTPGNPPGRVQWVTSSSNTEVGTWNEATRKTSLSLNYNPSVPSTVYHCQGFSSLGQGVTERVDYTPKFAYGPESVKARVNTPTVKKCPSGTERINVFCEIPIAAANPKPKVVVQGLNAEDIQPTSETMTSLNYRFNFLISPNTGGIFNPKCVATSDVISNQKVEDIFNVIVQEPPPSAPAVSLDSQPAIQNGQEIDVISGTTVTVRCDVQGGFPNVTKVTLSCMGQTFDSPGTQLKQTLSPTKSNNGDRCTCTAVHPSGCYTKLTQFTINVLNHPFVTKYTLDIGSATTVVVKDATETDSSNGNHQRETDVGTLVTFSCEGEGTPRPNMAVMNQRSQPVLSTSDVITSGSYVNKSVATKVMTCRDTGSYVCEASNEIGASRSAPVLILVKCTPELSTPASKNTTFPFIKSGNAVIVVRILGHPAPVNFTLTKVAARTKRSVRQMKDVDKYEATYVPIDELYGKVYLEIFDVTNNDEGQYILDIQNGKGNGLQYLFFIKGNEENTPTSTSNNNVGAIVGGLVGGFAIIAIIIIVIIYLYRKGKGDKEAESIYVYNNDDSINNTPKPHDTEPSYITSVDAPTGHSQYEEVNIIPTVSYYVLPDQPHGHERENRSYVNVGLRRDEEDTDNAATVYSNDTNDGQVGRADQPENLYDTMEEDRYNTPAWYSV